MIRIVYRNPDPQRVEQWQQWKGTFTFELEETLTRTRLTWGGGGALLLMAGWVKQEEKRRHMQHKCKRMSHWEWAVLFVCVSLCVFIFKIHF